MYREILDDLSKINSKLFDSIQGPYPPDEELLAKELKLLSKLINLGREFEDLYIEYEVKNKESL